MTTAIDDKKQTIKNKITRSRSILTPSPFAICSCVLIKFKTLDLYKRNGIIMISHGIVAITNVKSSPQILPNKPSSNKF